MGQTFVTFTEYLNFTIYKDFLRKSVKIGIKSAQLKFFWNEFKTMYVCICKVCTPQGLVSRVLVVPLLRKRFQCSGMIRYSICLHNLPKPDVRYSTLERVQNWIAGYKNDTNSAITIFTYTYPLDCDVRLDCIFWNQIR